MISRSMEEYLRTIYSLNEEGRQAGTTEIASSLGIKPSSVTEMLKKLSDEGYVKYEAYQGAELTNKGSKVASKLTRKHRLLERFLTDILKLGKNNIHEQACAMEHALSDEAEDALCRVLKQPEHCSDDKKTIPPCDKDIPSCMVCDEVPATSEREETIIPLSDLREGQEGLVTFIRGGRRACQRLADLGLTKDTPVKIVNSAPFQGPVEISVRGTNIAVGRRLATRIFVRVR